jgi:DNA replication protein DnaC
VVPSSSCSGASRCTAWPQTVGELTEQGSPAFEAAIPILSQLLKAETTEREVRAVAYQLKAARFPAYRDLNGFDFSSSEINESLVRQLHRCEFIEAANNIVLVGGPGTGKAASCTLSCMGKSSYSTLLFN